jgi:hypothetical protein
MQTTPTNLPLFPFLLVPLLCLRVAERGLYEDYCTGRATVMDVARFIGGLKGGEEFLSSRLGALIQAYLIYGIIDAEQRETEVERIRQVAQRGPVGDQAEVNSARQVAENFRWPAEADDLTPYLYKKIEMAQPFVERS